MRVRVPTIGCVCKGSDKWFRHKLKHMIVLQILQVPKTVSHALREAVLTGCAASSQVWSDGAAYTGPRWVGLVARLWKSTVCRSRRWTSDAVLYGPPPLKKGSQESESAINPSGHESHRRQNRVPELAGMKLILCSTPLQSNRA